MTTAHEPTDALEPPSRARGGTTAFAAATRDWPIGLPTLAWLIAWGAVLLVVLVVMGKLLAASHGGLHDADVNLTKQLASGRTPTLNSVTKLFTTLAETYTITAIALIAFIGFRLGFHRWRESLLVLSAVAGEVTVFVLTTLLVDRQRPPVPKLDHAPPTSSFPSGHTAAAVVMYGVLALVASGRLRSQAARTVIIVLAALIPVAVAVSRVYRGMHFPTDVLAGAFLGLVWLAVAVAGIRLGLLHAELRGRGRVGRRR